MRPSDGGPTGHEIGIVRLGEPSTLAALARDYVEDRTAAGLSLKTIESDIRPRLERIFLPWCHENGVTEPGQLDQRTMNRFSNDLLTQGGKKGPLSPHSVVAYLKTANAFLNWMRQQGLGQEVTGKAHRPRLPERHVDILTDAEVRAMIKLANPRDALIVQLLSESGIRLGELVALRTQDLVDQDVALLNGQREHQVGLRIVAGKGMRERFVPIPHDLHRRLRAYARSRPAEAATDRLWLSAHRSPKTGTYLPFGESGVQQVVRWLGRNALGRHVHPHLFRHTYISKLVMSGVDSTVIRRYVGHRSTLLIDQVYGHLRPQDTAAIVLAALRP